jgi:hypothetical protein
MWTCMLMAYVSFYCGEAWQDSTPTDHCFALEESLGRGDLLSPGGLVHPCKWAFGKMFFLVGLPSPRQLLCSRGTATYVSKML